MSFTGYLGLILKKTGRYFARTNDGRMLFWTFFSLFILIALFGLLPAEFPSLPGDQPRQEQMVEVKTQAPLPLEITIPEYAQQTRLLKEQIALALNDIDPVTVDEIFKAIDRLASDDASPKYDLYGKFVSENREVAIAGLEAMALAEKQRGATKAALMTFEEMGALSFLVDTDASIRAYEAATSIAPENVANLNQLAHLFVRAKRNDEAREAFRAMLDLDGTSGTAFEATALANLGVLAAKRGDFSQAEYFILRSLQTNVKLDRPKATALQHANLGLLAINLGKASAAESNLTKALAIFEDLADEVNIARSLSSLGLFEQARGNIQAAENYTQQSLNRYEKLQNKAGIADQYTALAQLQGQQGNAEAAEASLRKSLALNLEINRTRMAGMQYASIGAIAASREDLTEACAYWREATNIFEKIGASRPLEQVKSRMTGSKCDEV